MQENELEFRLQDGIPFWFSPIMFQEIAFSPYCIYLSIVEGTMAHVGA